MSKIHVVFGPQGAGKTTYSNNLAKKVNGVHMSIDQWMWKLFGEDLTQPMDLDWIMERVERCENQIWSISKEIVSGGSQVILDLGFTKQSKRKLFSTLSEEANLLTQLHYVVAPLAIRRQRVLDRNIKKGSTFSFEVTTEMFDFMEGEFEKPSDAELENALIIDTNLAAFVYRK